MRYVIKAAATGFAALAVTAASLVGVAGTASAAPTCLWQSEVDSSPSPFDSGVDTWAYLRRSCDRSDYYHAVFHSNGEHLHVTDSYDDGRRAKVYLSVEGNGTAVYTTNGLHNLSFDEGLDVKVKLCIVGTSTCTPWSPVGRT